MITMIIIITPENENEEILSQSLNFFSSWRKRITASNSHSLTLTLLT